eukprot:10183254-Alexandrium_andersonii.AAC.1
MTRDSPIHLDTAATSTSPRLPWACPAPCITTERLDLPPRTPLCRIRFWTSIDGFGQASTSGC